MYPSDAQRVRLVTVAGTEDEKERFDRKLIEMLNELRVALPGVQVLFAFLLTLPFTSGWPDVSELQKDVYFGGLVCAALASLLLIATSAYHRLRWKPGAEEELEEKRQMQITANRLAVTGLVFLALAMAGTMFLITDVLFGVPAAGVITAVLAGLFGWFWFGLPLTRRARDEDSDRER
jgi:Family of unknown function (DUF6328)